MQKPISLKADRGFTIIELMIVIGILGVIASIAVPSYLDYVMRGKVTEAVNLLGGLKMPILEYHGHTGHWPTSVTAVGGKTGGNFTTKIITGGSHPKYFVQATMLGNPETIGEKNLRMYYDFDAMRWWCSTEGSPAPLHPRYLPAVCR